MNGDSMITKSKKYGSLSISDDEAYDMYLSGRRLRTAFALTDELERIARTRVITEGIYIEEINAIRKKALDEEDKRLGYVARRQPDSRRVRLQLVPKD
jgi:hypothetical protein